MPAIPGMDMSSSTRSNSPARTFGECLIAVDSLVRDHHVGRGREDLFQSLRAPAYGRRQPAGGSCGGPAIEAEPRDARRDACTTQRADSNLGAATEVIGAFVHALQSDGIRFSPVRRPGFRDRRHPRSRVTFPPDTSRAMHARLAPECRATLVSDSCMIR